MCIRDSYHIALDDYEHGVVIRSLNDKKTDLKKEGKSTDAVDAVSYTHLDKMTPDKERENCPGRKAIINPFDAMMMVVVRRLDKAYLELKRSKPPAKEAEFALRDVYKRQERKYTFSQSQQLSMQTGLIGSLRADFGSNGNEFWTTWNDFRKDLKTDEFKAEFDDVINLSLIHISCV